MFLNIDINITRHEVDVKMYTQYNHIYYVSMSVIRVTLLETVHA